MPPKKKLAQAEIDALAAWVKMGAPGLPTPAGRAPAPAAGSVPRMGRHGARSSGRFSRPRFRRRRAVVDTQWPRSPIDRFILAKLEAAGLRPAPPADKRTLLRRATLDLSGFPPTPEEIDAFLRDDLRSPSSASSTGCWLRRVTASAGAGTGSTSSRYADSNGMDDNLAYSDAWRYRDYVIAAFNADKPYDQFVEEQLAGDLLAEPEPARRDELIVATGFLAIGPKMLAEDDPVKQQMDIVDEQLDTTCRVFLALTMGCARCHDHKFDPLAMSDYYALAGIFKSTRTMLSHRVDSKWNATGAGRSASGAPAGRSRADHRPARQRARQRQHRTGCRPRSARPTPAAGGGQDGIRGDPQGDGGRRGQGRATSRSSCAAII